MLRTSSSTTTLSSIEPEVMEMEEVEPLMKLDGKELQMRRPLRSAVIIVLLLLSFTAFIMYDREEAIPGLRGLALEDEDTNPLGLQDFHLQAMSFDEEMNPPPPAKDMVSLVTSFWSYQPGEVANPHRREIKAALLANIYNPHFDQVVVFLDGVTGESNCFHFYQEMKRFSAKTHDKKGSPPMSKLQCVPVTKGQPTYYQMFQNTFHPHVKGDIVVLSNADMAFDHTISLAKTLNPEVLTVLGTNGFSNNIPSDTRFFYDTLVGTDYISNVRQNQNGEWDEDMCRSTLFSWDTWIYTKSKIKGELKEDNFMRLKDNNEKAPFYMNENGAENAAMAAVQQSYPFTSFYNACDKIHSWSFHLTPKTHHSQQIAWLNGKDNVPPPYGGYKDSESRRPHPSKLTTKISS